MKNIMKNKTKIMIGITIGVIILLIIISGCLRNQCGDGICRPQEESRGDCPEDCKQPNIEIPNELIVKNIKILQEKSVHGDWSPDSERIVFERWKDFYFHLYISDSEGKGEESLTLGNPRINQLNNGWPVWHPSGQYIVFQSEEPEHYNMNDRWLPFSGNGFYNNLWATKPDGSNSWKLTDIDIKKTLFDGIVAKAVVSPHFSHDGTRLLWTERYADGGSSKWGYWQVRMADFIIEDGEVKLEPKEGNIIIRAEDICKECNYVNAMGISPDNKKLLLAGNLNGQHVFGMDQYIFYIENKTLTNLLETPNYWEEGSCLTPDGKKIIYPTNINSPYEFDFENADWAKQLRTKEYWIMDSNGSNKQQLTYFNTPGFAEYNEIGKGRRVIVAECRFSPDGKKLLGIIGIDKLSGAQSRFELSIVLIEF